MNNVFSLETARVNLLFWMLGSEKLARIDLLLSRAGVQKSDCTNRPDLPVPLTSPASLTLFDRVRRTPDIQLAV